jgi:4-hydroxybenzoate polyprenyltransferase
MSLGTFFSLIKIEHTLFALPLALTGAILAARGIPDLRTLILLAIAFTAARASAMAFNRLVDRRIDALNPRTADREIPSGAISVTSTGVLVAICVMVFIAAAWLINPLCGKLAPVALLVVLGYSYTKRFTSLCHYLLGVALGIAPVAGWLSVTGAFSWPPVVLGLGVILWTAGFDILYACQDIRFDREMGLYSLPARLGADRAMRLAALSHLAAFGLFLLTGYLAGLSGFFYLLELSTGGLLVWEHHLVSPDNLSRLDMAFFRANSLVSISLMVAVCGGVSI